MEAFVFDMEHAVRIAESKRDFLQTFVPDLVRAEKLQSGLDVGCGLGFFSGYLERIGLNVVGFDARSSNVAEAMKRNSGVDFYVYDLEDLAVSQLGSFDLVLCLGLLYHLENPFRAIRNLYSVTKKHLVIETIVAPIRRPVAALCREGPGEDQSLQCVALIPSEMCLVNMMYKAGFRAVYRTTVLPDHEDFHSHLMRKKMRTILVASKTGVRSPILQLAREDWSRADMWQAPLAYISQYGYGPLFSAISRVIDCCINNATISAKKGAGPIA